MRETKNIFILKMKFQKYQIQKSRFFLLFIFLFAICAQLQSQEVVEIPEPLLSEQYLATIKQVKQTGNENYDEKIKILSQFLSTASNLYERFNIIFWELSFLFAAKGQYSKCFQILAEGQEEGMFYPFQTNWPEYIDKLEPLDNFNSFVETNNQLRKEAEKEAKFEYFVQLPENYSDQNEYPLLIVLHGGIGSHIALAEKWYSPKLDNEYVVAFQQGCRFQGSFLRSYQKDNLSNIVIAYEQIMQKYSIDTSKIVLGSGSIGGKLSIMLLLDELIPASGLILAFPVKPGDLEVQKLTKAANAGIRAVFLCGEKDWAISQQKEMGYIFDKNNIKNMFIVFSGIGHEYLVNFSKEIDLSLDYIFEKKQ